MFVAVLFEFYKSYLAAGTSFATAAKTTLGIGLGISAGWDFCAVGKGNLNGRLYQALILSAATPS